MDQFAVKIIETNEKIILVSGNSMADGILKVRKLYENNAISTLNGKKGISISGCNMLPKAIERFKKDKNVLDLTEETKTEELKNLPFEYEL